MEQEDEGTGGQLFDRQRVLNKLKKLDLLSEDLCAQSIFKNFIKLCSHKQCDLQL